GGGAITARGATARSTKSAPATSALSSWLGPWNMEPGYQEEAPLVHDGVIFLGNPQNMVQALDGRTGDLLWGIGASFRKSKAGITTTCSIGREARSRCTPTRSC